MASMEDHLIPHITSKSSSEMYATLITSYQMLNISQKFLLKKPTTNYTPMSNTNIVASYLINITQIKDRLKAIKMKIENEELVSIALYGFSNP